MELCMKLIKSLYFWIAFAFIAGSLVGLWNQQWALSLEPLGSTFIKLVKIFIGPIVFLTVANGIAQSSSLHKLGKIGLKALIYFEIVSTIALLFGWMAGSIIKPGAMMHANLNLLNQQSIAHFVTSAEKLSLLDFLQNLIPSSIIEPFAKGDMLQVLLLAILFGISLLALSAERCQRLIDLMDSLTQSLFKIIRLVMYAAPLGVFGAMAFTMAKFGGQFLVPLFSLIATFYLTGFLFVFLVLGFIAKFADFSILRFLRYLMPEILLVLGTFSSESALPQLMQKLEKLGCKRETVGVVVPMGYSFNLDGTNIYITLAALFIAQALDLHLTLMQQFTLFATAMLTSKGAAGVTGAGFITLAATLAVVPSIPSVGIVLILGIDRFLARALVNFIGNGVAAVVISLWENEITANDFNQTLRVQLEQQNIL